MGDLPPSGKLAIDVLKLPFVLIVKILVTVLNFIPTNVHVIHGVSGSNSVSRPELRALRVKVIDGRKLHLGSLVIAWLRGAVMRVDVNLAGSRVLGVYIEVYEDIQEKWCL